MKGLFLLLFAASIYQELLMKYKYIKELNTFNINTVNQECVFVYGYGWLFLLLLLITLFHYLF